MTRQEQVQEYLLSVNAPALAFTISRRATRILQKNIGVIEILTAANAIGMRVTKRADGRHVLFPVTF